MTVSGDIPRAIAGRLHAALEGLETQRRQIAGATAALCGQLVLLALDWGLAPGSFGKPVFAIVLGLSGAAALMRYSAGRWRQMVNQTVVPVMADGLGGMVARFRDDVFGLASLPTIGRLFEPAPLVDLGRAFGLGLLPSANEAWADWTLAGEHRSLPFTVAGAVRQWQSGMSRNRRTRRSHHLLVSIAVPIPFQGRTLIARDGGPLLEKLGALFDAALPQPGSPGRLAFPHEAFESRFSVRTDDPAEARRLITPGVADGLMAIDEAYPDQSVRAAFHAGRLWMALDLPGPLMQQAELFRPALAVQSRLQELADELTLPHRLIDHLHGGPDQEPGQRDDAPSKGADLSPE